MLLVGSTARNTGKTTFCTEFIRKWREKRDIIGIKITTIHAEKGPCPRGEEGCGVCSSFIGDYEIIEENDPLGRKDTCTLLAEGAKKVYLVRSLPHRLSEAVDRVMALSPEDAIIVCESNALASIVTPGVIVVTHRPGVDNIKPSAKPMLEKADLTVNVGEPGSLRQALEKIEITYNGGETRLRFFKPEDI
jgi:hypothetical protein